jgi:diacylglycerol O-acyltransferase
MDAGFLQLESRETPMHVAGLNLFSLPEGADEERFLGKLGDVLCSVDDFRKPFGEYVTTGKAGPLGPLYWQKDEHLDIEYHVRHSALPEPRRYRELFALVGRLHSTLLDRSRPLWEAHLIEGLPDRQFALYLKMHHAAIDGAGALHIIEGMCAPNKKTRARHSPLSREAHEAYKKAKFGKEYGQKPPTKRELKSVAEALRAQFDASSNIYGVLKGYTKTWMGRGGALAVPWHHVPRTSLNRHVSGARRYVAQSWDMGRIKRIGRAVGGTVNDVVLAMCSGALRRYLIEHGELPKDSLKAMVPVSLREKGDVTSANVVNFITADLGTHHADPEDRMETILASMREGKDLIRGMSKREANIYTQLTQVPLMLSTVLGLADHLPPALSTTISNVPGPRKQLYWNGARLNGIYPVSAVFHGLALNITLVGYNNRLDFGITACRRAMPQVQRLIDYMEESVVELEEMLA